MRSELISIVKVDTLASLYGLNIYLQKTLYFLVSQRNIELKTSKHEFTDRSDQNKQGFEGKKLSGTEFTAFEENLCQTLPPFSYFDFRVCFACYPPKSFKTICLTCIWLKFVDISFHSMQKHPKYFSLRTAIFLHFWKIVAWSSKLAGGWDKAHNWLKLLTSCGPNLEESGSNAIFCDFFLVVDAAGSTALRRG